MANYSELCRLCAEPGRSLISLFNRQHKFVDHIFRIAEIQVGENDGLPQSICYNCSEDLEKLEQMVQKCRQSDQRFRANAMLRDAKDSIESSELVEMIEIIEEAPTNAEITNDDIIDQVDDLSQEIDSVDDLIIVDPLAQLAESQEANYTQCCGCVECFDSHEALLRHSQLCHKSDRGTCGPLPDNLIECNICYKMFSGILYLDSMHRLSAFKNRLSSVGFPDVMQCCSCEVLCSSSEEILQHSQTHLKDRTEHDPAKPFECEICYKRYNKKQTLNFHQKFGYSYKKQMTTKRRGCRAIRKRMEIEGSMDNRKCCGCSTEFTSIDSLKQHSRMHHELYRRQTDSDHPFECDVCFKRFQTQIKLEQHRLVPYTLEHKCSECEKSFRSQSVLTKHMAIHSLQDGESAKKTTLPQLSTPVQCDECGKFLQNDHKLRTHLKSAHLTDKPFQCSLCSRRFKWKHILQNHLRVHTKEQPYSCRHCSRSFTQLADKNRHELTHSQEFPLRCSVCGKGFPGGRKKLLEKHEELHQRGEEYPFTCRFCDRTFTRLPQRNRHQARHVAERNRNLTMAQMDAE
ncbi:zinc finger protein 135-like [Armigeres subalbatus]|uniref:zinc finger protein 135-like n=1 Tax=Armigeres subalbatus TaxID=124917 RepID=UPI002ED49FAA